MTSRVLRYLSVALVALALIATVAGGSADAKKKRGVGKSVDSSEIEDGTIQCADISAAVFPNGCPDDDSGAGTGTGTGTGGGGGGVSSFDASLSPNQTKVVNDGSFSLTTAADNAGICGDIFLNNNAQIYIGMTEEPADDTPFAQFAGLATSIAPPDSLTEYAATTISGNDSSSGNVGTLNALGNCFSFGHVL